MSGSRVIKGEPSATEAARLRRALNDKQKTEVRDGLRRPLLDRTAAVLHPPTEQAGSTT
jgi:hypothetical protein